MTKYLNLFLLFLIVSCSTMTKNLVMKGDFSLKGGRNYEMQWQDSLVFKRTSWYKELTMYFDVAYTHIDAKSPFYNWFSELEKNELKDCIDIIITAEYAFRPRDISKGMFKQEVLRFGYESFVVNDFERNLRMHPDFSRFQTGVYSTHAFCRRGIQAKPIAIVFPGFKKVMLD